MSSSTTLPAFPFRFDNSEFEVVLPTLMGQGHKGEYTPRFPIGMGARPPELDPRNVKVVHIPTGESSSEDRHSIRRNIELCKEDLKNRITKQWDNYIAGLKAAQSSDNKDG